MLIHVGYPKTGSSWLQRNLPQLAPRIYRIGEWRDLRETLIRPNPLWYTSNAVRAVVEPGLMHCRENGLVHFL